MFIDIALKLLLPIVICFFIGLEIDKHLSTIPLFAIIAGFIGMLGGIYTVYKSYTK